MLAKFAPGSSTEFTCGPRLLARACPNSFASSVPPPENYGWSFFLKKALHVLLLPICPRAFSCSASSWLRMPSMYFSPLAFNQRGNADSYSARRNAKQNPRDPSTQYVQLRVKRAVCDEVPAHSTRWANPRPSMPQWLVRGPFVRFLTHPLFQHLSGMWNGNGMQLPAGLEAVKAEALTVALGQLAARAKPTENPSRQSAPASAPCVRAPVSATECVTSKLMS